MCKSERRKKKGEKMHIGVKKEEKRTKKKLTISAKEKCWSRTNMYSGGVSCFQSIAELDKKIKPRYACTG